MNTNHAAAAAAATTTTFSFCLISLFFPELLQLSSVTDKVSEKVTFWDAESKFLLSRRDSGYTANCIKAQQVLTAQLTVAAAAAAAAIYNLCLTSHLLWTQSTLGWVSP